MDLPGFRRRVLIEPLPGRVCAELEDDWHRMVVTLTHAGGVISRVDAEMKRWPWSTCRGAIERLETTFRGVALADVARRGEKATNCTHLHDLALFAAAHAGDDVAVDYDIRVSDPAEDRRIAEVRREGRLLLSWVFGTDLRLKAPNELAGCHLTEMGDWIAQHDAETREAARLLRWAAIMASGRQMSIPAGSSAAAFPTGACYTFQPEQAVSATRSPGAWADFSSATRGPLSDRLNQAEAGRRGECRQK